ncbi:GNAT family N-acetyltransferase [Gammaproteobacteria bacterium]|nr:GNAT family N-acetyltransferase [Gammaproteobacteria bacterium]
MNTETKQQTAINILPPSFGGEKLIFRVYDHASPIGYARLRKTASPSKSVGKSLDMLDHDSHNAYELKMIEIAQNYRQQGLGTSLLKEIIKYCKDSNIKKLTGEIKGDDRTLRHWYSNNGFTVSNDNRIELMASVSC